ncbi:MAG: hypothetical protein A2Y25_08165 [Candidatus Melainabacteria bacterium GWF2_37_15]|nr:MAG: hypothetical protein A2Y25_08165 [Candidatus Melainabacteria bacterium GWF2_37_15]
MDSMDSVFEVKSINKEGFELYNLVNEKIYSVKSQIKMVNYRRLCRGNYLVCKIMLKEGEYYLCNIQSIIKPSEGLVAYKAAVSMQVKDPALLYAKNEEKIKEIEENVAFLSQKYKDFFKTEEIFTSSSKLNALLDLFNEYVEGGEKMDYEEYTETPENADIIVFFDSKTGLQTMPKDKRDSFNKEAFSVPTVLYSSKAFEKLMELSGNPKPAKQNTECKIGRNEPCVCGSGKKYKKCCL